MFRPGDVVIHTATGQEMEITRVLPGPVFRCAWNTVRGDFF